MIKIVNYGLGNIDAFLNIYKQLGIEAQTANSSDELIEADKIVLPGVGAFDYAMKRLNESGMRESLDEMVLKKGVPVIGICVGMQILFDTSEEAPGAEGLHIFDGSVKKFPKGKTPQIGWNKVLVSENNTYLEENYYYFVNSYYVEPADENIISAKTSYYIDFCSAVQKNNITAVQFHPEKSSDAGCEFFAKWLNIS